MERADPALIFGLALLVVGVAGVAVSIYLLYALTGRITPRWLAETTSQMDRRRRWLLGVWVLAVDGALAVVGLAILALPQVRAAVGDFLDK